MNPSSWLRRWQQFYRKDPILTMIVTMGLVEGAIGGLGSHIVLTTMGLGTAGGIVVARWWYSQRSPIQLGRFQPRRRSPYRLPAKSSSQPLPMLFIKKR